MRAHLYMTLYYFIAPHLNLHYYYNTYLYSPYYSTFTLYSYCRRPLSARPRMDYMTCWPVDCCITYFKKTLNSRFEHKSCCLEVDFVIDILCLGVDVEVGWLLLSFDFSPLFNIDYSCLTLFKIINLIIYIYFI